MITRQKLQYFIKNHNIQQEIKSEDIYFQVNQNQKQIIYLIHRALRWQLYQHRQGNAHTKTRNEVRGGGKKPWKQKGTGRARAGSTRSPLWKGGGVIFGPKAKTYVSKINKKEKKLAIQNIIYNKFPNTIVIENNFSTLNTPKTKNILTQLKNLGIIISKRKKILLIVAEKNYNLYLSVRNIENIELILIKQINILALLKADTLLFTLDSLNILKNTYNDTPK
uniref:Large ribosomal subunit protein uL4c n=1 Tax=Bornetia secundiflora TaxID=2575637 RepID=A0A4D6WMX4_9FLOR|nr:ribosomal protein L4 [Bornetia secundiflora]